VSLPGWASSIRARLTALSSLVLFGLMALVLALVYLDVQADIADAPVTSDLKIAGKKFDGSRLRVEEAGDLRRFEQVVNDRTLDTLRGAALVSLGALGVLSLGVGWVLSGRALRPVARITDVAAQIEASDLTRRIALPGPDDELKRMADTVRPACSTGWPARSRRSASSSTTPATSCATRSPSCAPTSTSRCATRSPTVERLHHAATVTARAAERMTRQVDDLLAARGRPGRGSTTARWSSRRCCTRRPRTSTQPARLRSLTLSTDAARAWSWLRTATR
jgi:HAMP domain-containing protein